MTPQQRQFILDNHKTMTGLSMAKHIKKSPNKVYEYMRENNIESRPYPYYPELTEDQKEYILNNYETKTINAMSKKLDWRFARVKHYMDQLGLKPYRVAMGRPSKEIETTSGDFNVDENKCWMLGIK